MSVAQTEKEREHVSCIAWMRKEVQDEENAMQQDERGTLAGLAVLCRSEAHLTLAAVASGCIQALAILAQVDIVCTLIHVWNTNKMHGRV